jgi:hypothetical protein
MASRKKRYSRHGLPPCPDPERYTVAEDKDGYYWRLRRGCGKPAVLNASFARNAALTGPTNKAAARILAALEPFLTGIRTNALSGRIGGLLKKAINKNGGADFSFFESFEFQQEHPLEQLLKTAVVVTVQDGMVRLCIALDETAVKAQNSLATDFYMEAVLLCGDALAENGLRTDSRESPLYAFGRLSKGECRLELELPQEPAPWMVLLKVSCLEGNELAVHPKHYGMRVVEEG